MHEKNLHVQEDMIITGKKESTATISQFCGNQDSIQKRYPLKAKYFPFKNKT